MAAVLAQPGLLSAMGYAKETTAGTYLAATDTLNVESFQVMDDPALIEFPVMRQSRNTVMTTRAGIHKVSANFTLPYFTVQGGALWSGALGHDTMSGATPVAVTLAASPATVTAGATSLTVTSVPATPSGVNNWKGMVLTLESGGTNPEQVMVLDIAGSVLTVTPTKFDHVHTVTCQFDVQHILQENVSPNKAKLDTFSLTAQFAEFTQWNMPFGFIEKAGITGDSKTIKGNFSFTNSEIPTDTTIVPMTPAAGEAADSPWIMRDGGLIAPFTFGGSAVMHSRVTALTYELNNSMEVREYGGGVQDAELYVPGERKQTLTWKEDIGQNSGDFDMWVQFVKTQKALPAYMFFQNPLNGACMAFHFPNCRVQKYDPVVSMTEPIGADGAIEPLEDPGQGYAVRVALLNSVTTAY